MPTTITDVSVFTDPVTAPDDGDLANGATFQDPIQDLSNRTRYHENRINALYGDTVELEGPLALNEENVSIGENLTVGRDLTVADDMSVADNATIGGDLTVTGAATIGTTLSCADLSVSDDLTVADDINCQDVFAGGRIRGLFRFKPTSGPDSDKTWSVSDDVNIILVNTTTALRVYTLSNSNVRTGDWYLVVNRNTNGHTISVHIDDGPDDGGYSVNVDQTGLFVCDDNEEWRVAFIVDFGSEV